jgi:hypothetical protein
MGTGDFSLGVKRPAREADHSPPSSADVKEWVELYLHSPNTPSWHGAQLKHRKNFTFTFTCRISSSSIQRVDSFLPHSSRRLFEVRPQLLSSCEKVKSTSCLTKHHAVFRTVSEETLSEELMFWTFHRQPGDTYKPHVSVGLPPVRRTQIKNRHCFVFSPDKENIPDSWARHLSVLHNGTSCFLLFLKIMCRLFCIG